MNVETMNSAQIGAKLHDLRAELERVQNAIIDLRSKGHATQENARAAYNRAKTEYEEMCRPLCERLQRIENGSFKPASEG